MGRLFMEFFDTVKSRHSTRGFLDKAVEIEKIMKILDAANSAPSARNLQEYEMYLLDGKEQTAILKGIAAQEFVSKAPAAIVFCAHTKNSSEKMTLSDIFPVLDAAIAASYVQLAAAAQGLGSVWVASFDPGKLLKAIGAPAGLVPIVIMPIGYPAAKPEPTPRRSLDDMVHKVQKKS
jgi:nitroreductase